MYIHVSTKTLFLIQFEHSENHQKMDLKGHKHWLHHLYFFFRFETITVTVT